MQVKLSISDPHELSAHRASFVGNHFDIQKTGLYCMQLFQEFFT